MNRPGLVVTDSAPSGSAYVMDTRDFPEGTGDAEGRAMVISRVDWERMPVVARDVIAAEIERRGAQGGFEQLKAFLASAIPKKEK